ncbi:MAG TPA: DEAD/DEAH box helicase [Acidothermaceae bacterium]
MSTRLATNLTTPGVIFPSRCGDADVRACPRRLRIPSSSDAKLGLVSAENYSSNPPPRPVGPARSCEHVLERLVRPPGRRERVTHVEVIAARLARSTPWPGWVCPEIVSAYAQLGIEFPWEHQVEAAELARLGQHVVIASGTASGKSLAYQLPVLQALTDGARNRGRLEPATALYLSPTKALAADQLRALDEIALPGVRAATYDGDTPYDERSWVRTHANLVLANPDLVHCSMLPSHRQWASFFRGLQFVVIDECHGYRGVFGAHVAQVIRRLRRVAARYGSYPVFVLASATVSEPAVSASRLIGLEVMAVTDDASPRGASRFVLWEPPLMAVTGHRFDADRDDDGVPHEATVRRSTSAETADLLADLVIDGVRTLAFVRSRRGAEAVALAARRALDEVGGNLGRQVAAYRAGYLPEERRVLERALRHGTIVGLAATTALELGVDVSGLDAVLLAGFPGTRASMWQQAGRAGRAGQESIAVLVARDDPLDTYLVHHPDALFGRPVEAAVFDPDNPYVLGPHLCAAASEWPLTPEDLELFGPTAGDVVADLVERRLLRARPTGWFWTKRERACDLADIRGSGGAPARIVDKATGQLLGTANAAAADSTVHTGAVYLHQGATFVVRSFDVDDGVALVEPADVDYFTSARDITDVRITATSRTTLWGAAEVSFGSVDVTTQVMSYLRRRVGSGEVLGEQALDLPERQLSTRAVWWTVGEQQLAQAGFGWADLAGAAHAAEHASIGLLPLVATCDRWDIGGVSTALHQDTGRLTVVVYDGYPGGAGFSERGYEAAAIWLTATREAIAACACDAGCPSCVQSPKCGNGNEPLDKSGAIRLLDTLLADAPALSDASTEPASDHGVDEPHVVVTLARPAHAR